CALPIFQLGIGRVGGSSFSITCRGIQDDTVVFDGLNVMVILDRETQRPTRIPDADREFLSQFGTFDPAHVLDVSAAPLAAAAGSAAHRPDGRRSDHPASPPHKAPAARAGGSRPTAPARRGRRGIPPAHGPPAPASSPRSTGTRRSRPAASSATPAAGGRRAGRAPAARR